MERIKKRSDCPVSCSLDILGDKWSLLIIRDLLLKKECTYSDFLKSPEKIATNILADRLQKLEDNGIIIRSEHPESKAKVLYRLTSKGCDLFPIIVEMVIWADKHLHLPLDENPILNGISTLGKDNYIESVMKKLKNQ